MQIQFLYEFSCQLNRNKRDKTLQYLQREGEYRKEEVTKKREREIERKRKVKNKKENLINI